MMSCNKGKQYSSAGNGLGPYPGLHLKSLLFHIATTCGAEIHHRGDNEDGQLVIPGEQRETRNPGTLCTCLWLCLLDSRLRGNDDNLSRNI